jgi:hypothetical protein
MVQRAMNMSSQDSELLTELGYINFLMGEMEQFGKCLAAAASFDPHNVKALQGVVALI